MRLTERAVALGKVGGRNKWAATTEKERKRIMSLVRAAKKKLRKMADDSHANCGRDSRGFA